MFDDEEDDDQDSEPRRSSHGKWSDPGVPHKGWVTTAVIDLEEPKQVCEMCEHQHIRYVHFMYHPKYPVELECGCICACHMSEDYVTPVEREKELRRKSQRRQSARAAFNRRVRAAFKFLHPEG